MQIENNTGIRSVVVYNALGAIVLENNSNSGKTVNLDISSLNAGVYIVRVTDEENRSNTKKLVKL